MSVRRGYAQQRTSMRQAQRMALPDDMMADLTDAFDFYDRENSGFIKMSNARNILNNFGYWKVPKKDVDDELTKNGLDIHAESMDFETLKTVVAYRWATAGKENECHECFRIFDKKDKGYITATDLKNVLGLYLQFPVTENEINEFMEEADKQGLGNITYKDFLALCKDLVKPLDS